VQTTLRIGLLVVHALAGAVWLGAMVYSLRVVQPRAARFFAGDDDAYEDFLATLAARNRWPVLALAGLLTATGIAAYALQPAGAALHAVKGLLLLAALAVFAYVSWRVWPKRPRGSAA
jgi:putative copper export protein